MEPVKVDDSLTPSELLARLSKDEHDFLNWFIAHVHVKHGYDVIHLTKGFLDLAVRINRKQVKYDLDKLRTLVKAVGIVDENKGSPLPIDGAVQRVEGFFGTPGERNIWKTACPISIYEYAVDVKESIALKGIHGFLLDLMSNSTKLDQTKTLLERHPSDRRANELLELIETFETRRGDGSETTTTPWWNPRSWFSRQPMKIDLRLVQDELEFNARINEITSKCAPIPDDYSKDFIGGIGALLFSLNFVITRGYNKFWAKSVRAHDPEGENHGTTSPETAENQMDEQAVYAMQPSPVLDMTVSPETIENEMAKQEVHAIQCSRLFNTTARQIFSALRKCPEFGNNIDDRTFNFLVAVTDIPDIFTFQGLSDILTLPGSSDITTVPGSSEIDSAPLLVIFENFKEKIRQNVGFGDIKQNIHKSQYSFLAGPANALEFVQHLDDTHDLAESTNKRIITADMCKALDNILKEAPHKIWGLSGVCTPQRAAQLLAIGILEVLAESFVPEIDIDDEKTLSASSAPSTSSKPFPALEPAGRPPANTASSSSVASTLRITDTTEVSSADPPRTLTHARDRHNFKETLAILALSKEYPNASYAYKVALGAESGVESVYDTWSPEDKDAFHRLVFTLSMRSVINGEVAAHEHVGA